MDFKNIEISLSSFARSFLTLAEVLYWYSEVVPFG